MAVNNRTYRPIQSVSITAAADIPAFRFADHSGQLCAAGMKSMGASEIDWFTGENMAIVTLGTIALETSGAIAAGDAVGSDENGKARTALPADAINGRALTSVTAAGFVTVQLIP